jgi:serine/threonine protein kinase
MQVYIR